MIKTFFKLLLCTIVFTIGIMIAYMALPFSEDLREVRTSEGLMTLLLTLVKNGWVCFVIYFIIRHTKFNCVKLFVNLLLIMFPVLFIMGQIELLFFINAFPSMVKLDVLFFMLCGLVPLLITIPLLMKFFQNKNTVDETIKIELKSILVKLGIIGIIYCFIYYIFGLLIAWQFEEIRIFYSNSSIFFQQKFHKYSLLLFPFQILRGILFGIFIIPLKSMITKNKKVFIMNVCTVYLSMGFMLLSPNALFPDMVRYAQLIEMTSSMLLFGIVVGNIMWGNKKQKTSA